jgi:hypothetical protein
VARRKDLTPSGGVRRKTKPRSTELEPTGRTPPAAPEPPKQLTCPYTGVEQHVVEDTNLGRTHGFHLSAGLDLTTPFLSEEDALKACPDMTCRYTGEQIDLVEEKGLWRFPDAFSPSRRFLTEYEAQYQGSMRMGRSVLGLSEPKRPKVVLTERERPENPFEDFKDRPDLTPAVNEVLERTGAFDA